MSGKGWIEMYTLTIWMVMMTTGVLDLCAELDRFGDPVRCVAVGPDMAPAWGSEVCCDAQTCYEPGPRGCATRTWRYWCDSAVVYADGTVDCVYEVPSYCDVFGCAEPDAPSDDAELTTTITVPPLEHAICCHDGGCYDHEGGLCGGDEVWCGKGVTNDDGTVTCMDAPG